MKFPYELSEQRISLLSKEDQRIYRFEHSDFFDYAEKQQCIQAYQQGLLERQGYYVQEIKKDPQFNALNESEVIETAKELTLYESSQLIDELAEFLEEAVITKVYTEDEAINYLKEVVDELNKIAESTLNEGSLNEDYGGTPGPDMTYWAKGLSGMLSGLFGGLMSLLIGFLMMGKTKAAMKILENYMNKIVEKVDDGVNKTKGRGLWAKLKVGVGKLFGKDWSGKNEGEQNTICLRTLQENFSSDIASKSMVMCKKLGLLPDTWDSAIEALKNSDYTKGSFQKFQEYIAKPINDLNNTKVGY